MKSKNVQTEQQNVSLEVKKFKQNLKLFKKQSKSDFEKGIEQARSLILQINDFRVSKDANIQKVFRKEKLDKLEDSLNLYIDNVSNVLAFKKKYDKDRGVKK